MIIKAAPQLPSLNFEQSRKFYENKLGFTLLRQYPDLLIFIKDEVELHLWLCDNPVVPQNSSVYFRVTGIEDLYEGYEPLGIIHPKAHLEDKPWGIKEFYVLDPDGNLLKFGQSSFTGK